MEKSDETSLFLEHCMLPSIITGGRVDLDDSGISTAGITGLGKRFSRGEKQSVWMSGEIISPNFRSNSGCACRGHLEGVAMDNGRVHLLESVYDFMAFEGDCYEYQLQSKLGANMKTTELEGELTARLLGRNPPIFTAGRIYLTINPYWPGKIDATRFCGLSLPFNNQYHVSGISIPIFWKEFLGQIEEQGYDHPYGAVTEKLKSERDSVEKVRREEEFAQHKTPTKRSDESLPF